MEEKYSEKLSKLLLYAAIILVIFFICRYFVNVLLYVVLAFVISLLAKPLMNFFKLIRFRKWHLPYWLLTIVSLLLIVAVICGVVAGMTPVIANVVSKVANANTSDYISGLSDGLAHFNKQLAHTFNLGRGFKIEDVLMDHLKSLLSVQTVGNILGSAASTVASLGVGLFSVVFISFFLIKDDKLVEKFITAILPDRLTIDATKAINDCEKLLSRYFVGLVIEMVGVGLIAFLGLWQIAKLDVESALGIGFIAGVLNIIPYVGPWIGAGLGTVIGVILKYCSDGTVGLDVSFWVFVGVLLAIFIVTQFIDNYLLQPIIYSASIKASPLEIFIVMLMAAKIGGIFGMLICIPAYTVVRVVVGQFFPNVKFVRKLTRQD